MTDCVLPLTGSNPRPLVLLAILAMATGIALVLSVRRRGINGGAALVVAFALAATALVIGDARSADAQTCEPATTVAQTTTTAPTTTAASTTSTTTATTTTASTTTTIVNGGAVPTTPTTGGTTTTTTLAAPDLTPAVDGPQTLLLFGPSEQYTVTVTNVGTAPTNGQPMTFTVSFPFTVVGPAGALMDPFLVLSADWTVSETLLGTPGSAGSPGIPTKLTFMSNSGLVIPAGGASTVTFALEFLGEAAAEFSVDVALPNGIGGETNATNNNASLPVSIVEGEPPG